MDYSLYKRKIANSPICKFYEIYEETLEHLLLLCHWIQYAWMGSTLNYRLKPQQITALDT